jgi:uncharacterized SAM-binding protein YcdF (DUF218 family)
MYTLDEREIRNITDYIFVEDELAPADVIFIPGCARPEHTEEAARLFAQGYAPLLIPSGGYSKLEGGFKGVKFGGDRYAGEFADEAEFLTEVLLENGVPREAIIAEHEATYTLENAEKTRELLISRGLLPGIRSGILCCKAFHARRASLYYRMVFPEIEIRVHPVPQDGIDRDGWYLTPLGRKVVFNELSCVGQQLTMMEGRIQY